MTKTFLSGTLIVLLMFSFVKGECKQLNLTHSTNFVVYPSDCNHMNTLFGGKILAEMDRTCGITVRRLLYSSKCDLAVTAGIESVKFLKPAHVGDLVFTKTKVVKLGKKSITVQVEVVKEQKDGEVKLAEGIFTFVSYDVVKKEAVEHGLTLCEK